MKTRRCWLLEGIAGLLLVGVAAGLSGCETTTASDYGEEAKEYGQYRLNNESDVAVSLWVGDELRVTANPKQLKKTTAPEGLASVSVRTDSGRVLWSQMADVPDNTFAQYNVQKDLSVILTAGNIGKPARIGSEKHQVRVDNEANYVVELLVDGAVVGSVGPYLYAVFNVPNDIITLTIRRKGGAKLFSQTVDVPQNAYFTYNVLPNGQVIATGGEVKQNLQEQVTYYYGY